MSIEYRFVGQIEFAEYLECHKALAAKRRLWLRVILLLAGGFSLLYAAFSRTTGMPHVFMTWGVVLVAYACVVSPLLFRLRVRRNWARYPSAHKQFDITVREAGVAILDDRGNPSHANWDNFIGCRETKSFFLLYLSPLLPVCLPKRLLPAPDIGRFRAFVSSAIPAGSSPQTPANKQAEGDDLKPAP